MNTTDGISISRQMTNIIIYRYQHFDSLRIHKQTNKHFQTEHRDTVFSKVSKWCIPPWRQQDAPLSDKTESIFYFKHKETSIIHLFCSKLSENAFPFIHSLTFIISQNTFKM